jgi:predicted O-linked N-acetylglucosamine transferase (SPINDLY family)
MRVVGMGVEDAGVYNNLATLYEKQAIKAEEGFKLVAKAFELAPEDGPIRKNFLVLLRKRVDALMEAGRVREALPLTRRWVELQPDSALAQRELGRCHARTGDLQLAIQHFTRAINLDPENANYYNDLGLAYYDLRLLAEAQGAFQQVLKLCPGSMVAYTHLGLLANLAGLTGVAVSMLRRALEVDPKCGEALNNMALFLRDQGEQSSCREHYLRAIVLKPDSPYIFSSYLLSLNDDPKADPAWVADEHRRYQHIVEGPVRVLPTRSLDPERRLKVGYLSPDFRVHSVGYFVAPLLEAHDREGVEVTCYASGNFEDAMTARMKSAASRWRNVFRTSDDELAAIIAEDGIDVLVELSGHTCNNRLAALARRVAPIQVTYLGYPNTTGLREMDYRITDAIADPPGSADAWHTEHLARVQGGFLAYQPPHWARQLPVADLPARGWKDITFGSFNNLAKINDEVLDTWAAILERVPGSRMFLKARGLRDEKVQARIVRAFAARNIDVERRLRLMGHERSAVDHLHLYNEVDLALDTFPYNGTTTTCEALWMGTPVVTFVGKSHAGRVGASLLDAAGLPEWVARDTTDYVAKAVAWASKREELAKLRLRMRDQLLASALMDAKRLARGLEAAYRAAWCKYAETR